MKIDYRLNTPVSATDFIELLTQTSLGARRPVDDTACIEGMLQNCNLLVSAWDGHKLVGIARSVTDFNYACYLSDLAVHEDYQRRGIGRQLQEMTRQSLGPRCSLILLAAPTANDYYAPLGYEHMPRCWVLQPGQEIDC